MSADTNPSGEPIDSPHAPTPPALELRKIHLSFGMTHILDGVDLTVRSGEKVVVIGPSGSGKSTLLRCVCGLEIPDSGEVRVFGTAVTASRKAMTDARRRMGVIFQHFNLYSMRTVLDNVTLAPTRLLRLSRAEAETRALDCLSRVGVVDLASKYPFQISGGQQQRVAIARALAMQPDILLLDEPTSALDPELVRSVMGLVESLASDSMTILCVTHDIGFAHRLADRVVFMSDGAVLEAGPPAEVLTQPATERLRSFLNRVAV